MGSLERRQTIEHERENSQILREKQRLQEEVERLTNDLERMAVENEKLKKAAEKATLRSQDGEAFRERYGELQAETDRLRADN